MEPLGFVLTIGLFACSGVGVAMILMSIFGVIGVFTLVPDNKKPLIRPVISILLVILSLSLLISM